MGVVREDEAIAGKSVGDLYSELSQYDFEIISIRRREHLILPHSETLLESGDRLALITSPGSREPLAKLIAPNGEEHEGGVQAEATEETKKGAD